MNEEKTFLNTETAKVTSARVVIGNQTFAMAGITSVEVETEKPERKWVGASLTLMYGISVLQTNGKDIGLFIVFVGAIWLLVGLVKTTKYNLVIRGAGGEVKPLTSPDATAIETIASAITDAMVYRG